MTKSELRLAVDLSGLQTRDIQPSHLRYTLEFLRAVEGRLRPGHLMTLTHGKRLPGLDSVAVSGTRLRRDAATVESILEVPGLVYHVARFDLAAPAIPMRLVSHGIPITATVLNLAVPGGDHNRLEQWRQRAMGAVLRTFDLVLTPSDWLASLVQEQCDLKSSRLVNIGVGCHGVAPLPGAHLTEVVFGPTHPHVIVADGDGLEQPNWETLLRAVAYLPTRIRVGTKVAFLGRLSPVRQRVIQHLTRQLGIADNQVMFARTQDPDSAAVLIQAASLFVHLGPGDGTGTVPLEAAAAGTPVLVADEGALRVLFDWEPARVDPARAADLADRIELVFSDPDFDAALRSHGAQRVMAHSWKAVADKAISAISKPQRPAARMRLALHPPRRRRLALVGSFDRRSLAGAFNVRLARALSMQAFVDAFGTFHHPEADGSAARRWPRAALGTVVDIADFDSVIYVLADDDRHAPILEAHLASPGSLLLLDDSLARVHAGIARHPDDGLRKMGEATQSAEHLLLLGPTTAGAMSAGLGLTDEVSMTILPVPSPEVDAGPDEPGRRHGVFIMGAVGRLTDVLPALVAMAQVPALRATAVRLTPVAGGNPELCLGIARAAGHLGLRLVHVLPELYLGELRLALATARVAIHVAGRLAEPLLVAEVHAAGTPLVSTGGGTHEVKAGTNLVNLLTDDTRWISAHRATLRKAPVTKMEEIADIILSTLPAER